MHYALRSVLVAVVASLALTGSALSQSQIFTVPLRAQPTAGCDTITPNDTRFVLGILEVSNVGRLRAPRILKSVVDCITNARRANRENGVVVVVFVHGWRHSAKWDLATDSGDDNIESFRNVLTAMSLREAERYYGGARGRTVIGVYVGWNGGSLANFAASYRRAKLIGRSPEVRSAVAQILRVTKHTGAGAPSTVDSPMILAGHSMGGLIVQSIIASSLENQTGDLLWSTPATQARCVRVVAGNQAVAFPDLVLLLNPATTAAEAVELRRRLDSRGVKRLVSCDPQRGEFAAPVIASIASESDWAVKWGIRVRVGDVAEGHNAGSTSHQVAAVGQFVCDPLPLDRPGQSFGQPWHCVREPSIANGWLQSAEVDLPHPKARADERCHVRFRIQPAAAPSETAYWIIGIPKPVVDGHGDIFNARSNSLFMSFAQLSGAVLSIHMDWPNTVERDPRLPCTIPGTD